MLLQAQTTTTTSTTTAVASIEDAPNSAATNNGSVITGLAIPTPPAATTAAAAAATTIFNGDARAHMLDYAPAPGWTVHVNKDGRLYYCNHVTKTASWLPPAEAWRTGEDTLPYGWERALDESGRSYYVNHVNKTTTYEMPITRALHPSEAPAPRAVTLERSAALGFGFVAGSEKPVIVRFVTEGGPSVDKLLPGDQIIAVNGEDVKEAPREHVIALIRACAASVRLLVCQPQEQQGARKSTLLSASKRARLRTKPSRVRFAESVCVNGAPLFPPSAFSLGDICVAPMANVLKVFLENGQTKSFKYDAWTTVSDVVGSLQAKLCLSATEHFSLVVEHIKSLKRNKLTLLDPNDTLARIASRPGAHKLRCLYRIAFVPSSAAALAQRDLVALDYLFIQCCNDVVQERFAPELQYDTALRLAALHVYQHALANNMQASKLTVKTVEREFGLERFVPGSLLEKMKRKEVRKLVAHFLKLHGTMAGPGKQLTALQAKLHYLDIVGQLPSYGAKCFSAGPKADAMERVILISPKFGISQIMGSRNSVPTPISNIEDILKVDVQRNEDELTRSVAVQLKNDHEIAITLEERDANELVLVLKGYYRLATEQSLLVDREENQAIEDLAPPYLSQHKVVPDRWSYLNQQQVKNVTFTTPPVYQNINRKTNGLYNTMGRQSKPPLAMMMGGYRLDSNMNSAIVKNNEIRREIYAYDGGKVCAEAKNDEVVRRVQEMQQLVEHSEQYLLNEQMRASAEWQETSVDVESDTESVPQEEELEHPLRHSDSLLLLTKGARDASEERALMANAAIEMLRAEINYSESDNDSVYTPRNSPKHHNNNSPLAGDGAGAGVDERQQQQAPEDAAHRAAARLSFGLHSPDGNGATSGGESQELRAYLQRLKNRAGEPGKESTCSSSSSSSNATTAATSASSSSASSTGSALYVFDPDIIDLTLLPPPATPDELDCALLPPIAAATIVDVPPLTFADSMEKLNKLGVLHENLDLEAFLASVTVPPPTQKVTPAVELTPEEIMSYIIPPPPDIRDSHTQAAPPLRRRGSVDSKPAPERPPKSNTLTTPMTTTTTTTSTAHGSGGGAAFERQRSQSMLSSFRSNGSSGSSSSSINNNDAPATAAVATAPKLPPRTTDDGPHPHQHLFLPPKKPPLPPLPPLEVLRSRKNAMLVAATTTPTAGAAVGGGVAGPGGELRTAGIGSPHLQRNRNMYNELDAGFKTGRTAVSTPTSPFMGRGAPFTAIPIDSPDGCARKDTYVNNVNKTYGGYVNHLQQQHQQQQYQQLQLRHVHVDINGHFRNQQSRSAAPQCARASDLTMSVSPPITSANYSGTTSTIAATTSTITNATTTPSCISSRENLLAKTDVAMASLLVRLDQVGAQCAMAQARGGGRLMSEEKFQIAKDELTTQSLQLVHSSKMLVIAMSDTSLPDLPEHLAVCLTILRRLTELCTDLSTYTTAPLQTRNLVHKVHAVTAAFRHLISADIDRSTRATIEEHLAAEAESLAGVLTTLLRSLRVFSP